MQGRETGVAEISHVGAKLAQPVDEIADRLIGHAEQGDVLLCAHGYLNWMIDRKLRGSGWRRAGREGGNHYWSWRIYEPTGARQRTALNSATAAAE